MAPTESTNGDDGPVFLGPLDRDNPKSGGRARRPDSIVPYGYLPRQAQFGDVERGNPLPYTLPPERRL